MPDETPCQIRCEACGQWADSRVQFETMEAFFASELVGRTVACTWCGEDTPCTIDNMRFYELLEGQCIGAYVEGKDAVKGGKRK